MIIEPTHPGFRMPEIGKEGSVGFDIFMPTDGHYYPGKEQMLYTLGFAIDVPLNVGLFIFPRSGVGINKTLEINNTIGLIDPGYTGNLMAKIRSKDGRILRWAKGDRLLQMVFVPLLTPELSIGRLSETVRGSDGLGSTGE